MSELSATYPNKSGTLCHQFDNSSRNPIVSSTKNFSLLAKSELISIIIIEVVWIKPL